MHYEKLKALMKIRSFWWKESCSLKIKVYEVLLCYKGKVSDESTSFVKKLSDICFYETLSFMIMKVIVFYEKKFIKKSFLISQDVSSLIQSCRLSDLN